MILGCIFIIIAIIYYTSKKNKKDEERRIDYEQSDYFNQTKNTYYDIRTDAGKRGEFYLSEIIKPLTGYKRVLYNCYVPKTNGETTEIDLILIHETGIYVIESKNYKGWIFGSEEQKNWTQTLAAGRNGVQKYHFFNPVMQNKGHIKWLKEYLNMQNLPIYSYIVFGNNATLKSINVSSANVHVLTQNNMLSSIIYNANCVGRIFQNEMIDQIYQTLYPLTQVSELQKMEHVNQVCRNNKRYYK